jgi:hypothetical protein
MLMTCAHCGREFSATNLNRKYCCNSCNVLASYARNGRPGERAAELEATNKKVMAEQQRKATKLAGAKKQLAVSAKKLAIAQKQGPFGNMDL